jgi:hypothetical protein
MARHNENAERVLSAGAAGRLVADAQRRGFTVLRLFPRTNAALCVRPFADADGRPCRMFVKINRRGARLAGRQRFAGETADGRLVWVPFGPPNGV